MTDRRSRRDSGFNDIERTPRIDIDEYLQQWSSITLRGALKDIALILLVLLVITIFLAILAGWQP